MRQFGLIGRNISYSFSKSYFAEKFINENIVDAVYNVFDLQHIDEVEKIFEAEGLIGFNVTIPYKQEIIPFLDELSPEAKAIGAVNTVLIKEGKRIGHNTDCYGFQHSLQPLLEQHHKKALVLGNGGAAKAIFYILDQLNITYKIVSRTKIKNHFTYDELNEEIMHSHQIIVNCSPVGTFPNIENAPLLPYQFLNENHLLYDLIYNPAVTKFLENGQHNGSKIKNGHEMLILQAEKAWEIWNNHTK
ncbi:shikimate dehydrogenase [Empedobacter falsenii]|uniref:Shikimate dehydrogenase n=1 Tax=Empedobacter stercoris TaxID=1628248 RepID=A0ABX1WK17_9FLAO|nr:MULTISPECIES: shikimate dehydrogenase [Empedobacter]MCA4776471.1 shikimate dehydrogenase [Empedobacter stercoris]MCA4783155.1 shikimate dehydrogenase [Empedobacter stercoris]MCA4809194.1 shikimate dehydrogenase [Empedobacter stercoris]MDM1524083.1 shikimate dehydrogenase [Empedobacter sp. 225-1]MDM1544014.1 shikimate dehydrogenase [Empedobacter sp. 189-2]